MGFAASAVALAPARAIRIRGKAIRRAKDREKNGERTSSPLDILISCTIARFYTWMFLLDSSFRYLNASFGCTSSRMVPSSSERGGGAEQPLNRRDPLFKHP